jgi:type IV pilus assembly protein PilM
MLFSVSKKRNIIGLDISDYSLKAAQFKNEGGGLKLRALSRINLPSGLINSGAINDSLELKKRFKTLISRPIFGKFIMGDIVASLPETKTFIKLIRIKKSPNHLSGMVGAEMEKHLPYSLKEVYFDWQIISDKSDSSEVLVGAVPRLVADQYTEFVDSLGYELTALEIEAAAISRSVLKNEEQSIGRELLNYFIIDIGAARSSVIAYSGGSILFTLSLSYSTSQMLKRIVSLLKISPKEAYRQLMQAGRKQPGTGQLRTLWEDELAIIRSEILEAYDYYQTNYSERGSINVALLCGGGSNLFGVKSEIENLLSCSAKYANVLTNSKDKQNLLNNIFHDQGERSLEYATAIGLALRS